MHTEALLDALWLLENVAASSASRERSNARGLPSRSMVQSHQKCHYMSEALRYPACPEGEQRTQLPLCSHHVTGLRAIQSEGLTVSCRPHAQGNAVRISRFELTASYSVERDNPHYRVVFCKPRPAADGCPLTRADLSIGPVVVASPTVLKCVAIPWVSLEAIFRSRL
jgi:hypothetical protein